MDNMATIHITRMPHKKYEQVVFTLYLNDDKLGSLSSSESTTVEAIPGPIKLKAVVGKKLYTKLFTVKEPGDYYFNLEIKEPKWHVYFKFSLSVIGLILILFGLYDKTEFQNKDFSILIFAALMFLAYLDKREEPMWEEVTL